MLLDTLVVTPSSPGGSIANHIPQIMELLSKTLADPESLGVRVWSVRALGKLAEFIESGEDAEIVRRCLGLGRSGRKWGGEANAGICSQAAFQSLVPGIVSVISQTLEAGDEDAVKFGFEVIENLTLVVRGSLHSSLSAFDTNCQLRAQETPLLTPHLSALVQFLLSVAANQAYDGDLRIMALNALLWLVKLQVPILSLVPASRIPDLASPL